LHEKKLFELAEFIIFHQSDSIIGVFSPI